MHLVMTMQRAVKDSWSVRQVWWCPSTLTTKLVQWQNLATKQDTGKSHGHQTKKLQWNMVLFNTDQVKDLRSRGDVGERAQLAHRRLMFQSRSPLPRQCYRVESNSIISCQVHVGHGEKIKSAGQATCLNIVQNKLQLVESSDLIYMARLNCLVPVSLELLKTEWTCGL